MEVSGSRVCSTCYGGTYIDLIERHIESFSEAFLSLRGWLVLLSEVCLKNVMLFLSQAGLDITDHVNDRMLGHPLWVLGAVGDTVGMCVVLRTVHP